MVGLFDVGGGGSPCEAECCVWVGLFHLVGVGVVMTTTVAATPVGVAAVDVCAVVLRVEKKA